MQLFPERVLVVFFVGSIGFPDPKSQSPVGWKQIVRRAKSLHGIEEYGPVLVVERNTYL